MREFGTHVVSKPIFLREYFVKKILNSSSIFITKNNHMNPLGKPITQ